MNLWDLVYAAFGVSLIAWCVSLRRLLRARRDLKLATRRRDNAVEMREWVERVGDWPPS